MASGQKAASSCSPLALERGLSAALSVAACCSVLRNFAAKRPQLFFLREFVELRWPRVEAGAWKRVLGGWD